MGENEDTTVAVARKKERESVAKTFKKLHLLKERTDDSN